MIDNGYAETVMSRNTKMAIAGSDVFYIHGKRMLSRHPTCGAPVDKVSTYLHTTFMQRLSVFSGLGYTCWTVSMESWLD